MTPNNNPEAAINPEAATAAADASTEAPAPATAEEQLAALQARNTELSDDFLRAKAEAENTRRRSAEEISKEIGRAHV